MWGLVRLERRWIVQHTEHHQYYTEPAWSKDTTPVKRMDIVPYPNSIIILCIFTPGYLKEQSKQPDQGHVFHFLVATWKLENCQWVWI